MVPTCRPLEQVRDGCRLERLEDLLEVSHWVEAAAGILFVHDIQRSDALLHVAELIVVGDVLEHEGGVRLESGVVEGRCNVTVTARVLEEAAVWLVAHG